MYEHLTSLPNEVKISTSQLSGLYPMESTLINTAAGDTEDNFSPASIIFYNQFFFCPLNVYQLTDNDEVMHFMGPARFRIHRIRYAFQTSTDAPNIDVPNPVTFRWLFFLDTRTVRVPPWAYCKNMPAIGKRAPEVAHYAFQNYAYYPWNTNTSNAPPFTLQDNPMPLLSGQGIDFTPTGNQRYTPSLAVDDINHFALGQYKILDDGIRTLQHDSRRLIYEKEMWFKEPIECYIRTHTVESYDETAIYQVLYGNNLPIFGIQPSDTNNGVGHYPLDFNCTIYYTNQ